MINTYQTSVAPPPVPPRYTKPQPFLIPAQLPVPSGNKPLIRFLVCVVMLQLVLSVGGFLYLFYKQNPALSERPPSYQGRVGFSSTEKQETTDKALAHMVARNQSHISNNKPSGYLQWKIDHSVLKKVNYYRGSWLTILEPGVYYVYSRVTFSKGHIKLPLANWVMLRKTEDGEEEVVMKAYCSLSTTGLNPHLCSASQGDLIPLKKGNQLSVWVQDLSLVDCDKTATVFGIYKL